MVLSGAPRSARAALRAEAPNAARAAKLSVLSPTTLVDAQWLPLSACAADLRFRSRLRVPDFAYASRFRFRYRSGDRGALAVECLRRRAVE